MPDLPEHCGIGINLNGEGPVAEDDPDWVETVCWCGDATCRKWLED